jgi:hypothetical protein
LSNLSGDFSFFQAILDYLSNYFGPIFEDITMRSEQLPKRIQEDMSNAAHSSIEEILHLQGTFNFRVRHFEERISRHHNFHLQKITNLLVKPFSNKSISSGLRKES